MQKNSFEIYKFLEDKNLLENSSKYWWPNVGTFEVLIGAILTQNTSWKNVEKSLENLASFLEFESFLTLDESTLKEMIKPSGFYNQKAPRLLQLSFNIKRDFNDFKNFQANVTREWLLMQKGIGEESADSILCYTCYRNEMVVDTYTKRLLKTFDIEFDKYYEYKKYLEKGIRSSFDENDVNLIYARFHGMIVEYNKKYL
ncbi:MAG: 3-methyladenine DNA glycosylase [Sulfurimonas sp.]|nr:3-methyladenine DNA glycosylase [Sulfurimonas sp.]